MLKWLKRFLPDDPLDRPCASCGGQADLALAPEKEAETSALTPYCFACVEPVLRDGLRRASGTWVTVEPFADANCYAPYTSPELGEFGEFARWPEQIAELLAQAAGRPCEQCGAPAEPWVWVTTPAEQTLAGLQGDAEWFRGKTGHALCGGCIATSLLACLRDRGVRLYELVLPEAGPGIWLSWGY